MTCDRTRKERNNRTYACAGFSCIVGRRNRIPTNGVVVRTVPAFGHPSLMRHDMLLSRCMFEPRVGKLLAIRATSQQQPAAPPRRIRAAPRLGTTKEGEQRRCR
jgi:hypothetical protein